MAKAKPQFKKYQHVASPSYTCEAYLTQDAYGSDIYVMKTSEGKSTSTKNRFEELWVLCA